LTSREKAGTLSFDVKIVDVKLRLRRCGENEVFELMLFNSDLVRQRQVDYTETLARTMRASRRSRRRAGEPEAEWRNGTGEARVSGQPLRPNAAADCG
jgi:hypothetical protein